MSDKDSNQDQGDIIRMHDTQAQKTELSLMASDIQMPSELEEQLGDDEEE